MKRAIIVVVSVLFLGCKTNYPCDHPYLYWSLPALDSTSLSIIEYRSYPKGDGFMHLGRKVISGTSIQKEGKADTLAYPDQPHILVDYDWEIYLPAIQRSYKVTDLYYDELTQKKGVFETLKDNCSDIVHYNVNGTAYTAKGRAGNQVGDVGLELE